MLLVPPMMLAAEIYDVSPATSAVTMLHEHGVDPWVVDFGAPEREEGGLERTLADHVLAVSDAVDRVRELTGRDVHLGGYSQGGMFCYQVGRLPPRRRARLADHVRQPGRHPAGMPFGIPEQFASGARRPARRPRLPRPGRCPAWASRTGFRLLDPVKSARSRLDFILQLHDREALLPREGQRRFLEADGWVAWPGPAMADFLRQFIAHNRMLEGGFVIEDRLVTLADIELPDPGGRRHGRRDRAGRRRAGDPPGRAARRRLRAGAARPATSAWSSARPRTSVTWPTVAGWARWRAGDGELPGGASTAVPGRRTDDRARSGRAEVRNRVGYGLELAGGVGAGHRALDASGTARRTARGVRELAREAAGQLPRLARLEQIQPSTRISLGLLLEERMHRAPDDDVLPVRGPRPQRAGTSTSGSTTSSAA